MYVKLRVYVASVLYGVGAALALVAASHAEDADDGVVARHAAYGGEFTSSAWLKAKHSAETREPLCPFDPGPGGLCRNCHQKRRHEWHRPRTPPQAQLTNGDNPAAPVTVVGPGGEKIVMPELAPATVLCPRGQEPADEAITMHEEYRKAKEARKARIERLPAHEREYSLLLESTEAEFRSLGGGHGSVGSPSSPGGAKKRQMGRSSRQPKTGATARKTGPEADLAALLERRWDEEWTLLERSVGSKKEGARQRDLASVRAQEQATIQKVWNTALDTAKVAKLTAAAEQLRERKLGEEEKAAKQALAAAKLKREIEAEQARQAAEAEKAEQEAMWRAMTSGFTSLLDEYGIGGGGGVIRDGKVVKLREGLQERRDHENRTAARVQA